VNAIDLTTPLGIAKALVPELILAGSALVVLLVVAWRHRTPADARLAGWLSALGLVASGGGLAWLWMSGARADGQPQIIAVDNLRISADAQILNSALATVLVSLHKHEREGILAPEY
jgi:NADH:ubiquinone oxidoreductase subunit 2 (subunit N)